MRTTEGDFLEVLIEAQSFEFAPQKIYFVPGEIEPKQLISKHRTGAFDELQWHAPRIAQHGQLIAIVVTENIPFGSGARLKQLGASGRNIGYRECDVQDLWINGAIIRHGHGRMLIKFQHHFAVGVREKMGRGGRALLPPHRHGEVLAIPCGGGHGSGDVERDVFENHQWNIPLFESSIQAGAGCSRTMLPW
jgi:hypothetical protein